MTESAEAGTSLAQRARREGVELIRFLAGAAAVYLVITTVFFRTFYIPSSSMEPTLEVHDRVLVLNFVYGWSRHSLPFGMGGVLPRGEGRFLGGAPGRGDVIVFRHPERREHLIKRVIGMPGDRVQLQQGRLYINDELIPRAFEATVRYRHYQSRDRTVTADLYVETLPGGRAHDIYEVTDTHLYDDTGLFIVPQNRVMVMGDNRDSSEDSRSSLSYVPVENIVGRAVTVLFTFKNCRPEPGLTCPRMWDRVWRGL